MSSQLTVPSKAALTALSGLVVGTSCTLVLVTEDRRRRINAARNAISNAEKIKSAKRYNSAGTAFALIGPDEDLSDAGLIRWKHQDGSDVNTYRRVPWMEISPDAFLSEIRQSKRSKIAIQETPKSRDAVVSDSTLSSSTAPAHSIPRPITSPTFISSISRSKEHAEPSAAKNALIQIEQKRPDLSSKDDLSMILAEARDLGPDQVDQIIALIAARISSDKASESEVNEIVRFSARLARKCQDTGLLMQAQHILTLIINQGPISEADYNAFNPLEIVRSALKMAEDTLSSHRPISLERLRSAMALFLPKLTDRPRQSCEEIIEVGRQLIQTALDLKDPRLVDDVFWRVCFYFDQPIDFTQWTISALHQHGQHKRAIKFFSLYYSKMHPYESSFQAVGDTVVEAVDAAHGFKAKEVLTVLAQSRPASLKLKTRWVTKLLYCQWQRQRSYEKSTQLFRQLATGESPAVTFIDALYRVMIQISIEAGEESMAEHYFEELVVRQPEAKTNPRILGLLALIKAKQSDWNGVRKDFEAMDTMAGSDQVFVPILKEYVKTHTIRETENFMKVFLEELHVPLCSYMVTLIAKEYGNAREVQSFVKWIEYCTSANINADAALSHAILVNCRRWGSGFESLQDIYSKLQQLSPDSTDEFTDRLMLRTSYSGVKFKYGGTTPRRRVRALNIKPDVLVTKGRTAQQGGVFIAMKQAMVHGNPRATREIFTRAMRRGMPFCERCFKLAVQSAVPTGGHDLQPALELLFKYQQAGYNISTAAIPVLESQLSKINVRSERGAVMKDITTVLEQFSASGITLTEAALTHAAKVCLKAKHFTGAISLALAALRESGETHPDHLSLFSVFMSAYVGLADPRGIEWAIEGALNSSFGHSKACMKVLKLARVRLRASIQTQHVKQSLVVVQKGIIKCQALQERSEADRKLLETETMRIMQTAAEEARYVSAKSESLDRPPQEAPMSKASSRQLSGHPYKRDESPASTQMREIFKAESFNRPIAVGGASY